MLPTWQKVLFGSLHKAYSTDTLYQKLCDNQPIILVSDASVQKSRQSRFAWVLAHNITPLWHSLGLAPGPAKDMYSGHVEAFGIFAALTFLQYYLSCYDTPPPSTKITCFCNNIGVITMLTNMQSELILWPNDTTNDDRNIYLPIVDVANWCTSVTLCYLHVKGHQDKYPHRPLTIEEQHNVDCDTYAKAYIHDHPTCSTNLTTPEFPAAQPHLKIQGKVICCQYLQALHQNAVLPAYWDYLHK